MTDTPAHAIAAVQHANPYPFYAALRSAAPLIFDPTLQLWLVAQASVIRQVLAHPAAKVRPKHEPVPAHLVQTGIGQVFARLIRMTDGPEQQQAKSWLHTHMQQWSAPLIRTLTLQAIQSLQRDLSVEYAQPLSDVFRQQSRQGERQVLNEFIQRLPVQVVARLLAFSESQASAAAWSIAAFIRALQPAPPVAAGVLQPAVVAGEQACNLLVRQLQAVTPPPHLPWQQANLLGLLMQSYEATAGLIGNSLVALTEQQLWSKLQAEPSLCQALVAEVARYDAPVQNTRRFMHDDGEIAGIKIPAGSTLLLLLAAAGRDGAVYPQPDQFRLDRPALENLTFSSGAHQCPGQALAQQIAAVAIEWLLTQSLPTLHWRYRPSANGRLSWFFSSNTGAQP